MKRLLSIYQVYKVLFHMRLYSKAHLIHENTDVMNIGQMALHGILGGIRVVCADRIVYLLVTNMGNSATGRGLVRELPCLFCASECELQYRQ